MTLADALANLVQTALPWYRWVESQPRPPHTVEEALAADIAEGLIEPEPARP